MRLMNPLYPAACLVAWLSLIGTAPAAGGAQPASSPAPSKTPARMDALGWPLPDGAIARLGSLRFCPGHGAVRSVAFSPDGKFLASSDGDGVIKLWDVHTGKELRRLGTGRLAYAPTGNLLAAASHDEVQMYQASSGLEVCRFSLGVSNGLVHFIGALTFSPDGQILAVAVGKRIHLWDVRRRQEVGILQGHTAGVSALSFAPNGKTLASGGEDQSIRLWDVDSRREVRSILKVGGPIAALAYSPDGRFLASGESWSREEQRSMRIWSVADGQVARRLPLHHHEGISSVSFSPNGKLLAAAGGTGTLYVWEPSSGRVVRQVQTMLGSLFSLCFSPDGTTIAVGGEVRMGLWDARSGQNLYPDAGHQRPACTIAFSPDGRRLASGSSGELISWDLATLRESWHRPSESSLLTVSFSPDGSKLAYGRDDFNRVGPPEAGVAATLVLTAADSGQELYRFPKSALYDPIWCTAFSPDGGSLAAAHSEHIPVIELWSVAERRKLWPVGPVPQTQLSIAFSPDGKQMASAGLAPDVPVFQVESGKQVRRLEPLKSGVPFFRGVAFSPDGRMVLAVAVDGSIPLWDITSGKPQGALDTSGAPALSAVFSADGKMIASGGTDHQVHLWEVASQRERACFAGHADAVKQVAFSPDDSLVASASLDSTILLWDVWQSRTGSPKASDASERQHLWEELRSPSAADAYQAMCRLARDGAASVAWVDDRLRAVPEANAPRIHQLVNRLDSDSFAEREKATDELALVAEAAEPLLRRELARRPAPETKHRLERLLEAWHGPVTEPENLRSLRAIELLEHIGTVKARQVLDKLSQGASTVQVTREARAALARLRKRPACRSGS